MIGTTVAWAAEGTQPPALNTIVMRMEQAQARNQARTPSYSVTRAYKFFDGDQSQVRAQVIAQVNYQPPGTKTFRIQQESGNQHGIKVAHRLLESEARVASDGDKQNSSAIDRENYDFRFVGQQMLNNRPAYVLQIIPKQKEKDKVNGQVWVDKSSYLIQRIEGDLAKSPSWWIRDIHLVIDYGQMAGLWLQKTSYTVANIRFSGRHSMSIEDLSCEARLPGASRTSAILRNTRPVTLAAELVQR
jgi:outer membrane lipoprotein-sorting protein